MNFEIIIYLSLFGAYFMLPIIVSILIWKEDIKKSPKSIEEIYLNDLKAFKLNQITEEVKEDILEFK